MPIRKIKGFLKGAKTLREKHYGDSEGTEAKRRKNARVYRE